MRPDPVPGESGTYECCGLILESDLPIPAPSCSAESTVRVRWDGFRPVPDERPDGDPLIEVGEPGNGYVVRRERGGGHIVLRVDGVCQFRIAPTLDRVDVSATDPEGLDVASTFLGGTVCALILALAGHTVLHGSAVEWNGRAIAVVGGSGSGKSTLTAALCGRGARLVSDDVLCLAPDAGGVVTLLRGGDRVRLRPGADRDAFIAALPFARSNTSDGRVAIAPAHSGSARVPLDAIACLARDGTTWPAGLHRLGSAAALTELTRHPRPGGWIAKEWVAHAFRELAQIARHVPVFSFDRAGVSLTSPQLLDVLMEGMLSPTQRRT